MRVCVNTESPIDNIWKSKGVTLSLAMGSCLFFIKPIPLSKTKSSSRIPTAKAKGLQILWRTWLVSGFFFCKITDEKSLFTCLLHVKTYLILRVILSSVDLEDTRSVCSITSLKERKTNLLNREERGEGLFPHRNLLQFLLQRSRQSTD